jgi:hypothetical protein
LSHLLVDLGVQPEVEVDERGQRKARPDASAVADLLALVIGLPVEVEKVVPVLAANSLFEAEFRGTGFWAGAAGVMASASAARQTNDRETRRTRRAGARKVRLCMEKIKRPSYP